MTKGPHTVSNIELHKNDVLGVELRTVVVNGQPLVSAEDLAKALGYSATEAMVRSIRDRHVVEVSRKDLGLTPGRAIRYVTEAGLYAAAMRSRLPAAETFQDWVTDEVLPAIKRDGGYLSPDRTSAQNARLGELIQHKELRDFLTGASDYRPSVKSTGSVFAGIQDYLYLGLFGQRAKQIKETREIVTWSGKKGPTKAELDTAKNYLSPWELVELRSYGNLVMTDLALTYSRDTYTLEEVKAAAVRLLAEHKERHNRD